MDDNENLNKNTRGTSGVGHRRRPRYRSSDRIGLGRTRRTGDCDRPHAAARNRAVRLVPRHTRFELDVTQEEQWRSVAVKSRDVGEVDIVVNNAGYFPNRSIDELDLPTWRKTMATNLDSHFLSVKYFLPAMRKKKWGRFVGISSNMVGLAIPGMSHYIATKMGIIGFMRGLANDVASDGITANAVLPGLTNTLAIAPQSEEQKRATWEQQAIKRLGEPEDVTGAVLFLTSDDAAFITGQAIVVDGGQYRIG